MLTPNSAPLPVRTREYELRVDVTATVYLTASGTDVDEAIRTVTNAEVFERLSAESIDIDVSED